VLETRLRKLLREKLSGTYSITVQPSVSKIPHEEFQVGIELGADPKRIDELSRAVFEEIHRLQTDGRMHRRSGRSGRRSRAITKPAAGRTAGGCLSSPSSTGSEKTRPRCYAFLLRSTSSRKTWSGKRP